MKAPRTQVADTSPTLKGKDPRSLVSRVTIVGGLAFAVAVTLYLQAQYMALLKREITGLKNPQAKDDSVYHQPSVVGDPTTDTQVGQLEAGHMVDSPMATVETGHSAGRIDLPVRKLGVRYANRELWQNCGRISVTDAIETIFWALTRNDPELANVFSLTPEAEVKLANAYASLPENVRFKHPSPSILLANMDGAKLLGLPNGEAPTTYRLLDRKTTDTGVLATIKITSSTGTHEIQWHLRRGITGWQVGPIQLENWEPKLAEKQ